MKTIYTLILLTLLSSCYTKKKAIEKFCNQTKADTTIVIRDTVILDSTHTDTVFSSRIDSIYIEKGKLSIKYIKVRDSVYLSGTYKSDTIVRVDTIRVSIPINIPNCNKTTLERIRDAKTWLLVAFFIGVILGLYMQFKR